MQATKKDLTIKISDKIAVDTTELQLLCGCGRRTAVDIGTQAKARVQVGKRVLWSVNKVQKYLDAIATE